jgi:hypothetical protein
MILAIAVVVYVATCIYQFRRLSGNDDEKRPVGS